MHFRKEEDNNNVAVWDTSDASSITTATPTSEEQPQQSTKFVTHSFGTKKARKKIKFIVSIIVTTIILALAMLVYILLRRHRVPKP